MSVTKASSQCIVAIVSICVVALVALEKGVDSQLVSICIVAIAGLGGYELYARQKGAAA